MINISLKLYLRKVPAELAEYLPKFLKVSITDEISVFFEYEAILRERELDQLQKTFSEDNLGIKYLSKKFVENSTNTSKRIKKNVSLTHIQENN